MITVKDGELNQLFVDYLIKMVIVSPKILRVFIRYAKTAILLFPYYPEMIKRPTLYIFAQVWSIYVSLKHVSIVTNIASDNMEDENIKY